MTEFNGKVVAVTGAAGNLGSAVSAAFYNAGAKLAVIDRERDYLQRVFSTIAPEGDDCLYVTGDLTDDESVQQIIAEILQRYGRLDVLVNIAGGFTSGPPLHETPVDTWDFMLNLNARTAFLMCRAAIPQFLSQESGKIINIGARAALNGRAFMAPYIVSKSAVIRLTESIADELQDYPGINVNCVLPGTIDTPRNRSDMPDADYNKWVAPEALADVIYFLASDAARAVHGAAIPVYGHGQ